MSIDRTEEGLSRRELLQLAGGITFTALVPLDNGWFAALFGELAATPKFSAMPYLQPGTSDGTLVIGKEQMVVAWQTDGTQADFMLSYGQSDLNHEVGVEKVERQPATAATGRRVNYAATMRDLELNTRYRYRVTMDGKTLIEGYFTTRKPRGTKTRFVAFGDNSCGSVNDHAIAYQAYMAHPDFVMNVGDNVYSHGLDSEYAEHFFPVYNAEIADPGKGAPLLRSIPFYSVLANHDLTGNDPHDRQVADFTKHPDSLGYFTNLHLPLNGPKATYPMQTYGDEHAINQFAACAGSRYPTMGNYSFDYGDIHFLCLDSNIYVDPTDQPLQSWIASDLAQSDATWKIVVFHHPPFNVGKEHYSEQHMRVLAPLYEKHSVDLVLSGHEHNYQRSKPFRFMPMHDAGAKKINSGDRMVPGAFSIDRKFDGHSATKADGVVYIVTGAGGNDLYDPESNRNPKAWVHAEDDHVEYVEQMISDRHSLSMIDVDRQSLEFSQVDGKGNEIDRFKLTKR